MIIDALKDFARPSSPLTIAVALAVTAIWLRLRPSSAGARRTLLFVAAAYWLIATPLGATILVAGLSRGLTQIQTRDQAQGADVIVVLGGGAQTYTIGGPVVGTLSQGSVLRALEAARVYRAIGARLVIASAGIVKKDVDLKPESEMLRDTLIQVGVPAAAIEQESASRNTREQARALRPMLEARGARRFVLVTSLTHMRRALATLRAEGLDPIPSAAPLTSRQVDQPFVLLPNDLSLYLSDIAIYDYLASAYYWIGGRAAH